MSGRDSLPALSTVDPKVAVSIPVLVAPFGYLLGWLFVVHLVPSEAEAIWLTTVALTVLTLLVVSLRS